MFLSVSPRVFKVSFRIQTGENKAKELLVGGSNPSEKY